ncbi:post-transcriptional regulator [Alkalibacillus aidingensis]|uniref:post-transcriptional regulator n=1 Tax=Alkalibacillus aidingensis TaxID=2747607 RepID=UPI00166013F3|nr:post-transcriptional regulator [Alkalibacillus aidingensis]
MEPVKKHVNEWKPYINEVIQSKVEELVMLGYDGASQAEVWECLNQKVWRKNKDKQLHEVVQDILHMSGSVYMSFLTVQAQQQDDQLLEQIEALTQWEAGQVES